MTFFAASEFACRCGRPECDAPKDCHRLLRLYLNRAREMLGAPIVVTSGNRCAWHNAQVGGVAVSEHVDSEGCLGADLACTTSTARALLLDAIRHAGITRVVLYPRHVHVGIGDMLEPPRFPGHVVALGR